MRQFLKGRDTSQSIKEVKVFYPWLRKYGNLFQIQSERQNHQFSEIRLKPISDKWQPISVHVDFAKIIKGKLGLFKAVPTTFISIISFLLLGHEKSIKVILCDLFI